MRAFPRAGFLIALSASAALAQEPKPAPTKDPAIDYSGLVEFARVVAILEQDREPTEADWQRLFRTPGYAALTYSEFPESFFTEFFGLVFMPSRQAELEERLASLADWRARYLRHFVSVRERWDEVMAYPDDPRPRAMIPEARRLALEYLPARVRDHGTPPVAFVVFGPDARGYVPVVMDALQSLDNPDLVMFLGHEFHHYYRYAILDYDRSVITPEDEHIMWVFDQLHAEGTANQVNRRPQFQHEAEFARRHGAFYEQYLSSPDVIREMDRLLTMMDAHPDQWVELGLAMRRAIPSSGHPTGFFMANLIAQELGMDELVEKVGNPFAFLRQYHAAALNAAGARGVGDGAVDAPILSDASLRVIERLERRYVANP